MPRIREVARVVLLDERDRIFLTKVDYPWAVDAADGTPLGPSWIMPGGGVEEGETHELAAVRELEEETGLVDVEILDWVWSRDRELVVRGEAVSVRERYCVARVEKPTLSFDGLNGVERETLIETRWWRLEEIRESEDLFVPRNLAELLKPILAGKLPDTPLSIGR